MMCPVESNPNAANKRRQNTSFLLGYSRRFFFNMRVFITDEIALEGFHGFLPKREDPSPHQRYQGHRSPDRRSFLVLRNSVLHILERNPSMLCPDKRFFQRTLKGSDHQDDRGCNRGTVDCHYKFDRSCLFLLENVHGLLTFRRIEIV